MWNFLLRPSFGTIVLVLVVKRKQNANFNHFKTLVFSLITAQWQLDSSSFNHHKFDWNAEDQQLAFAEWRGQIELALEVSSIQKDIWFATIIGYLGKEGFRWWNTLPISKDANGKEGSRGSFSSHHGYARKVSTSYWNHINEMYSDIKQGDDESIDKLDQCIKNLVKKMSVHRGRKTGM